MRPEIFIGFFLVCWLSVVSSAAIDHSIHARDVAAGSTPVDTSASNPPPTQDAAESRGTPYVMQSGQGSPPPPPVPVPAPQPGGVYPQAPYTAGGPTAFGTGGSAYHEPTEIREEVTTNLECQKTYMNVFFKFSKPFGGYIYPYGFFDKCILFVGHGEKEVKLTLSQDICGAPPPPLVPGYSQRTNPFIEHRLMIQWDTDLVQEYDTNILIRCDRPEDYNRTIKFDLSSVVGESNQAIVRTHPGPKLWMEIQDGEGPTAPPVLGPVFLGQTLSLVFTLGDDVFNFDSNVLSCWATDGKTTQPLVPYVDPSQSVAPARPLVTQLQVIDASCSVKPKLFGNFQKIRESTPTLKTTTEWVLFKAFRFPTTARVLIQCDIQVCFEKCYPQTPCNLPYNSRTARKRRAVVNSTDTSKDVNPERLSMYRAIEVFLPKDEDNLPIAVVNGSADMLSRMLMPRTDCLSPSTFYGVILGLGIVLLIIIAVVAVYVQRQVKKNRSSK